MKEWKNSRKEYRRSPKKNVDEKHKSKEISQLLSPSLDSRKRDSPNERKRSNKDDERVKKSHKDRYRSKSRSNSREKKRNNRRDVSRSRSSASKEESMENHKPTKKHPFEDRRPSSEKYGPKDQGNEKSPPPEVPKVEPDFKPSGILAKFTNTVNGVVLKFTEPPDAKVPNSEWRLYPFKEDKELEIIYLKKQSCFLFGKDKRVADFILAHPTISSQHAVIQFREILTYDDEGNVTSEIKPYIMDLESTNGTMINGEKIESARYIELLHSDVIRFAQSTRDYVLFKTKSVQPQKENV